MIKTKSIHEVPTKDDGIRVCVMRRIKPEFIFDVWVPALAPSEALLTDYNEGVIDWEGYLPRFGTEVLDNLAKLPLFLMLKALSENSTVTLLCHEETDEKCHRRLLKEKIEALGG